MSYFCYCLVILFLTQISFNFFNGWQCTFNFSLSPICKRYSRPTYENLEPSSTGNLVMFVSNAFVYNI